jgi:exosome complex RNA-binding protein Rrp42 (RNase PH superfamily)
MNFIASILYLIKWMLHFHIHILQEDSHLVHLMQHNIVYALHIQHIKTSTVKDLTAIYD